MPKSFIESFWDWLFEDAPTYPRDVDAHTKEVAPGHYVLSTRLINPDAYVPPGKRAVTWRNGEPVRFEPIRDEKDEGTP